MNSETKTLMDFFSNFRVGQLLGEKLGDIGVDGRKGHEKSLPGGRLESGLSVVSNIS